MSAFETELGLMPELGKAVDEQGWLLPTDIQSEAIPLILGGGDVLMAAETGSGKTGAFCLPVLQIVYESLCEKPKHAPSSGVDSSAQTRLSIVDKGRDMAVDDSTEAAYLVCKAINPKGWAGCRATRGVCNGAKAYFECLVRDQGVCRYGWSLGSASLDLGTDDLGFGFGSTGKKSHCRQFDTYGEPFALGDRIGSCIDLSKGIVSWMKNGQDLGLAYNIPKQLMNEVFFPSICMKGSTSAVNFGGHTDLVNSGFNAPAGYTFVDRLDSRCLYDASSDPNSAVNKRMRAVAADVPRPNAPLCIVIEPSRELAEQTLQQFKRFKTHILPGNNDPAGNAGRTITELLLIGGVPIREQLEVLQSSGAHIVVATPGRLEDFISQGELELDRVRFFVLDELDGLLKAGYRDMITRLHKQIPQYTDKGRLQMIVCSATLHNFDVKKLAEQLMHFPSWIDLKGQDSVPDTVHHCVCYVDPLRQRLSKYRRPFTSASSFFLRMFVLIFNK